MIRKIGKITFVGETSLPGSVLTRSLQTVNAMPLYQHVWRFELLRNFILQQEYLRLKIWNSLINHQTSLSQKSYNTYSSFLGKICLNSHKQNTYKNTYKYYSLKTYTCFQMPLRFVGNDVRPRQTFMQHKRFPTSLAECPSKQTQTQMWSFSRCFLSLRLTLFVIIKI